jgi:hypothetical protein
MHDVIRGWLILAVSIGALGVSSRALVVSNQSYELAKTAFDREERYAGGDLDEVDGATGESDLLLQVDRSGASQSEQAHGFHAGHGLLGEPLIAF